MRHPDVIVVGAGAAGAVLAARLSEDPGRRVLLIEAGHRARGPLFSVPLMTGLLLRSRLANWSYRTEPEPHLDDRRLAWPRGKALGGSTAINGMVYMRGLASDFDGWAQRGLTGWSFADVLPRFMRSERHVLGDASFRGREGPLDVGRASALHPLNAVYLEAARAAGHVATDDFNGASPAGVGTYDFTIHRGRRVSSATAFLDPVRGRENLAIRTGSRVLRVAIENRRAVGVVVASGRDEETIRTDGEIVLSAGTIGSPHLLMLSGIGPADALRRAGIAVVQDLPGVGKNLQDHLLARVVHRTDRDDTIDRLRRVDRAAAALLQAWMLSTGPAASFPIEVGGLIKSDPSLDLPDLQTAFMPGLSSYTLHLPFIGMTKMRLEGAGFFANVFQMRPESRGSIDIVSSDPAIPPAIRPNYLSSPKDRNVLREGVRRLREIFAQSAFEPWRGPELAPGPDVVSDAEIDAWLRASADTVYHPVGTCRMGAEHDALAVTDRFLRMPSISGLRVADASVMPTITSSNTAAPTIMIAETCADLMRGRA